MLSLIPLSGLPLVNPGDPLGVMLSDAIVRTGGLQRGDILVVAQKVVSKAEGRIVRLDDIVASEEALELARQSDKDPRLVELILSESHEVLRIRPGLVVVEDTRGFVCANAGIDRSNIQQHGPGEYVALLPLDPDHSARRLRSEIAEYIGFAPPVIINDSHGRAWRDGTVGVTIGLAGISPLADRRGDTDLTGYVLQHTVIGVADEIAAAASLLMGPADEGIPAVVVRGLDLPDADSSARELQRPRHLDLFR